MRTPGERTSGAWTGGCVIHPDGGDETDRTAGNSYTATPHNTQGANSGQVLLQPYGEPVTDCRAQPNPEVILDGRQGSWLVFLLGGEVDALAGPFGSAFQSEVVMILRGQLALSPSGFQDCLGDDWAMHEDAVNVGVLPYVLCDLLDESLLFLCDCHLAYLLNKKGSLVAALGALCFLFL